MLPSCIYDYPDEDCIDGVTVRFDWKNFRRSEKPPGMSVHFYPLGDTDYYGYNLPSGGGVVNLPDGVYNIATFNYDSESVLFIGDSSFATLAFTTRPTVITASVPAPPKSRAELDGQPVMEQPGDLWTTTDTDSKLTTGSTVVLTPRNVVARYTVNVIGVENLHSVSRALVSLSGLAGEYFAASGLRPGDVPVIVSGPVTPAGSSALSGLLRTFGKTPSAPANTLRLYLWLIDGEKKIFEWNVERQIETAPDPMDVIITVEGVRLPDISGPKPPSGSGMEVDVDNWEVINIELST